MLWLLHPRNPAQKSVSHIVPLPEHISVWWACPCGFQVLQHKDLTCHGPRRKKHLNQVHGIHYSDMPPDPPGAPDAEGTQTKRGRKAEAVPKMVGIGQEGWMGEHA